MAFTVSLPIAAASEADDSLGPAVYNSASAPVMPKEHKSFRSFAVGALVSLQADTQVIAHCKMIDDEADIAQIAQEDLRVNEVTLFFCVYGRLLVFMDV